MIFRNVLILIVLILSGCTTTPKKDHILSIDGNGNAVFPGKTWCCDALNEDEDVYINKLLNTKNGEQKIIIYIHGGLNHPAGATETANGLIAEITDSDNSVKPLFIHWRSGLLTTYWENLMFNRNGEYWKIIGPFTFPLILIEDFGRGLIRAPMTIISHIFNYERARNLGNTKEEKVAMKITDYAKVDTNGFGELPKLVDKYKTNDEEKYKFDSINQIKLMVSLIPMPTLFDPIGTSAWKTMKRRTETMFIKDKNHDYPEYQFTSIESYSENRKGAATKFFDALAKKQKEAKENGSNLEIILIGHSMGAIIANKILNRWPNIVYSKIIYMAPATSIEDYRLSVLPYMRKEENKNTYFYNYTLHPINENIDNYWYVGGFGSLLTQIDNIYESIPSEDRRTLGRWSNIMNGINYIGSDDPDVNKRLCFRTMPQDKDYPSKHEHFDDLRFIKTAGKFWTGELGAVGQDKNGFCPH